MVRIHWLLLILSFCMPLISSAQEPSPEEWGGPVVEVKRSGDTWLIRGKRHKILYHEKDLTMAVDDGRVVWKMAPSSSGDILVRHGGRIWRGSLAGAGQKSVETYSTGYMKGVRVTLKGFGDPAGGSFDPVVVMDLCLEGEREEVVCEIMVIEGKDAVEQLDWPGPLQAEDVDYTLIPTGRGNLIPRHWPHDYHPFRYVPGLGENNVTGDTISLIQANHIECWSMSWWGFKAGSSSLIMIVETPDDAGYRFEHPAGGPTVIGPRWYASLGRFRYPRRIRMDFLADGNYVSLAKRYRKYVKDIGQFVSLREKIVRQPGVARLIGAAHLRPYVKIQTRTFTAIPALSYDMYKSRHQRPQGDSGASVMTFDELAGQLLELKNMGVENIHVVMCGWTYGGYDVGHPDPLPPAPEAGGWKGYRRYVRTCHELGYTCVNDDQYRDYYRRAHSFDPRFAIHESAAEGRPLVFPGTRFEKHWKEGKVAFMNYWAGGDNAYLDARYAVGHVIKNYTLIENHGIHLDGIFFDVMGYVPPTEDFNPEHPLTRTDCMRYRARMFSWARNNLGIVGTEDGADWVVPYVDYTSVANEGACVPVPLYNLVYHDAIITQSGGFEDPLRCILNAGYVQIDARFDLEILKIVTTLQKRVGLLEMTDHHFLDDTFRKEQTIFADGTVVTVDRDAGTWQIDPPLVINGEKVGKGVIKR